MLGLHPDMDFSILELLKNYLSDFKPMRLNFKRLNVKIDLIEPYGVI